MRKHLKYGKGENHSRYKGRSRFEKHHGYQHVAVYPGEPWYDDMAAKVGRHGWVRYIPEHRWVMANHLGRALKPWEHVHHINRNKVDNRLENLELVNGVIHSAITRLESENVRLEAEVHRLTQLLSDQQERAA